MRSLSLLLACSYAFLIVTPMAGQDYRGRVIGVVTDQTQAVVPSAKITLTNDNTGIARAAEANTSGQYLFDLVEPGMYTVSVEAAGFSKYIQKAVQVQVRGDVTVNCILQVGGVAETVSVSEAVAQVQFNTTTMELTVDQKMLKELPVLARNPFTLALLDPAVVNRYWDISHRNPFFMWSSSTIEVGGNTYRANDLYIDGSPVQIGPKGSYSPSMDAVQEFSVQQNSVDAEFGHSAGGVLSLGMKAGTNEFHGTAYYFGRNPKLNAVSNSVARAPNMVRNHIWGGTLGNPIIKNKLFTFTAYEQWKSKEPLSSVRTLPTDLERTGDFSRSLNANGGLRTIFDPWTTQFDATANKATRTPFPGNVIPQSRIDPTAARFMKDVWAPNNPGSDITGAENFKKSYFWYVDYWNFSERVDWNINDKWRAFGRYSQIHTDLATYRYVDSPAMKDDNAGIMHSRNVHGDVVWIANEKTVVNVRGGFSSLQDDYDAPPAKVSTDTLAQFWPGNPWYQPYVKDLPAIYYPLLSVTGGGEFGMGWYWWQHPMHYNVQASVRRTEGSHSLKAGFESRFHRSKGHYPDLMDFSFGPGMTADTFLNPDTKLSGDAWATFLLGAIDGNSKAKYTSPQNIAMNFYAGYVQDDYRLNRNITLNLGLRWEYESSPVDELDRVSRYLDLTNPIPEMQSNPPQIPADVAALFPGKYQFNGAWIYTDSQNRGMFDTNRFTFMPRIGIAVRLSDKMALRVGYARYVVPPLTSINTLGDIPMYGFHQQTNVAPSIQGLPGARLSDPFPVSNPLLMPVGKAYGRYTNLGESVSWDEQEFRTAVNDRFNVSLQRQLPGGYHFDGTYFLNLGHDFQYDKPLNMVDPQLGYTYKGVLDQRIANPFYQYLTPDKFPGALRNQQQVTRGSLLRTYPQYGNLTQTHTNGRLNRYHSMQLRIQKSFSKSYSMLWTYNFNREKNEEFFNAIDQYADRFTFINSSNPRHRMNIAGTYEFPIGRGQRWFSAVNPIINHIIGGWNTSSIFMLNSGSFLRFGDMLASGDPRIDNATRDRYFDTSVFKVLPAYTPRTNPWQYEGVVGPAYWNLDTSVSKNFPMTDRFRLEFKLEAYNLTNAFMAANPNMTVTNSLFGRSTGQANRGREMQYTLRLHF